VAAVLLINGPIVRPAVVADVLGAGMDELEITGGFDTNVHPGVIRLVKSGGVVPEGAGGETGLVRGQVDLQSPGSAREQVERADDATAAAVRVAACEVIYGREAVGRVPEDAVVGLHPAAGPRPAHRDIAELDHVVEVDEGPTGRPINGGPDLAADLRQDEDLQV